MTDRGRTFPGLDRKARMQLPFQDLLLRPPEERVLDFENVTLPFDPQRARQEAARCIHCPDPAPCQQACPAHNDISLALWLIEQAEFIQAARLYRQTSSMPEVCGQVCPHEDLCQGACVRSKRGEPIHTGALEAFAAKYERQVTGTERLAAEPTGRRVAIVGAGPSGLACAEQLIRRGHQVAIYEAKPAPGGLLVYGIPNFKLPKEDVFALWSDLERDGVRFFPTTRVGQEMTLDDLFTEGYEAVYAAIGAGIDSPMEVDGEDLPGVIQATEFLIRANVPPQFVPAGLGGRPEVGARVAVIGGGDTASDCLRSALRLGAKEVTCLYRRTENEMPGGRQDRELARQEGAQYQFLTQPLRFLPGQDGRLAQVECIRMQLGEADESGRRRPIPVAGSNFFIAVDTAILALGYWPDPILGKTTPGLETHQWGLIVTDPETGATSRPGVYAGGDAVTGPSLVVTAMVAGRKAAAAIDAYLQNLRPDPLKTADAGGIQMVI